MGVRRFFMLATHFDFSNKVGFKELLNSNTFWIFDAFWVLICKFMFFLVGTLIGSISRVYADKDFEGNRSENSIVVPEQETPCDSSGYADINPNRFCIKEVAFCGPDSNHGDDTNGEDELCSVLTETALIPSNNRYEFLSDKFSICGFVEEPKAVSFVVQEHFLCSDITEEPYAQEKTGEFSVDQRLEKSQDFVDLSSIVDSESEKDLACVDSSANEEMIVYEVSNEVTEGSLNLVAVNCGTKGVGLIERFDVSDDEFIEIKLQKENWGFLESVNPSIERSREKEVTSTEINNDDDDDDVDDEDDDEDQFGYDEVQNENLSVPESENLNLKGLEAEDESYDDDAGDNDDEFELDEVQNENLSVLASKNPNIKGLEEEEGNGAYDDDEFVHDEVQNENLSVLASENLNIKGFEEEENGAYDDDDGEFGYDEMQNENLRHLEPAEDDFDEDDDELEHDEVIERLRMELKTARTGGLSTILEESEFPELLDEVKPMKIGTKPGHKDLMAEIQKVYKNYAYKMRKLDVLNSQTSHSISLLRLKDQSQSGSKDGSLIRTRKPLKGQNLWPFKQKRVEGDRIGSTSRDIHRDFETVYVGQLCLSWEILNWQYIKTLELKEHDVQSHFQYNLVAGEFQLFQVLLQRFTEMEPFQKCPRIENYVKNRIGFHNFLQVPLIKDDRSRGNKCRSGRDYAIPVEALRQIIFESMHVFWEFLHADKSEAFPMSRSSCQARVSPQEPLDLAFLTDIRHDLQKKEKKLNDILRSGTCAVKKLRKSVLDGRVKDEIFVARVELQLVSRVLNMSKLTTDHLLWCREKLNTINFCNRKIRLDPTFSFFPC